MASHVARCSWRSSQHLRGTVEVVDNEIQIWRSLGMPPLPRVEMIRPADA